MTKSLASLRGTKQSLKPGVASPFVLLHSLRTGCANHSSETCTIQKGMTTSLSSRSLEAVTFSPVLTFGVIIFMRNQAQFTSCITSGNSFFLIIINFIARCCGYMSFAFFTEFNFRYIKTE